MRLGILLGAALGALNTGVVVLLDRVLRRQSTDFGWYSYSSMPRRYADYLPAQHVVSGWAAVALLTGVLVAVNMVLVAAYVVIRRRRTTSELLP